MKELPKNFRDIPRGTEEWMSYWYLYPKQQKEMEQWSRGQIAVLGKLTPKERLLFRGELEAKLVTEIQIPKEWTLGKFLCLCQELDESYSFIYLGDLDQRLYQSLNFLFSLCNCNLRVWETYTNKEGERV
jgi:hypothetical protein